MIRQLLILLSFCMLAACTSAPVDDKQPARVSPNPQWQPPAAGTTVDQYQEQVTEDQLNEKYFRVTVKATDSSRQGVYQLKLEFGYNINETTIQLPEWTPGIILKPMLHKGPERYQCLLGFDAGDGVFHELYLIKADKDRVALKQTKGYYKQPGK